MFGQSSVAPVQLTFSSIGVPGAGFTGVEGINSFGDVVGYYGGTSNGPFHSFVVRHGNFTFFDYPGGRSTVATGINDSGLIVGYAGSLSVRGFTYDGVTFFPIQRSGDSATFAIGINNTGTICGGTGTIGTTRGFELLGGHFKRISPPPGNFVYVYATGINNFGELVGWDETGGFALINGKYVSLNFPGADLTEALAVNDSGVIIGWYGKGGSIFGFAFANGRYTSFAYPGAKGTLPRGINNSGQIVGEYTSDFQTYYGFVTSSAWLGGWAVPDPRHYK
ncbi:MAG TPA: hypothetical protein VFA68_20255 [Terriglobales bacterium]|nr:hypothetical protein [Terriglobales bacterium]